MRIYKPAYTKEIPPDAEIKTDKGGANPRVTLKDRDGITKVCPIIDIPKKGKRIRVESSFWWLVFRDHNGVERRLRAYREEANSEILRQHIASLVYHRGRGDIPAELMEWADKLEDGLHAELASFGVLKPRRTVTLGKGLEEMLPAFEEYLTVKKERCPDYVKGRMNNLRAMFKACGFERFSDIDDVVLDNYLMGLRKAGRVKQKDGTTKGLSKKTINTGYLQCAQQFCMWAVRKHKVAKSSPLDCMEKWDHEDSDRKQIRRALTRKEVIMLLRATRKEPERFGMTGNERALLYRFALWTGLRAKEIRNLTVEQFDFADPEGPVVYLEAAISKHRERDEIPLKMKVARKLSRFVQLQEKRPKDKMFGGSYKALTDKTSDMLAEDLKAAGIQKKTVAGSVVFHSLRHTFTSSLKGIATRQAQGLSRHKSSEMIDRYTHRILTEKRATLKQVSSVGMAG